MVFRRGGDAPRAGIALRVQLGSGGRLLAAAAAGKAEGRKSAVSEPCLPVLKRAQNELGITGTTCKE